MVCVDCPSLPLCHLQIGTEDVGAARSLALLAGCSVESMVKWVASFYAHRVLKVRQKDLRVRVPLHYMYIAYCA